MKYRVTDLEHFAAAASCTTFTQAALKLEISQPALSQSIKRLESDSGVVLFYRSRSGIRLTPSGRTFLASAQKALQSLHELEIGDRGGDVFRGRSITLGCHPLVAQYSIPRALAHLKTAAPDYRIELRHDLSRTIQAQIQRGDIDIGIVINPTAVPDLVIRKLGVDDVRVWTRPKEPDLDTIVCDLHLFQTQSILKRWKNKPGKIISSESLELICRLTAEGIGYGILPARAVRVTGARLAAVPALPTFRDEICLVFRPEFGRFAAEKLVIEAIERSFEADPGATRQTAAPK